MDQNAENKPLVVPREAKHDEAAPDRLRWAWTKPWIWTDRMLTALEKGVKGGRAFFARHGLFSLTAAHRLASQSSSR